MELPKKIGDDWAFDIRNVKSGRTGQALDAAALTWKLYDREETVIDDGTAALYDAPTASFEFAIPKVITAAFEVNDRFRLDVIATHAGMQTTRSLILVAVVNVPAHSVSAPIDFEEGALLGLATVAYVDAQIDLIVGGDMTIYSLVDGTRAFTGVVGGITPTLAAHLATKGYVDTQDNAVLVAADVAADAGDAIEAALRIAADLTFSKTDGTRAFTNPVAGITPTDPTHLVTKAYADALGGGGGGTPGGADTQLQYNNAGAFGGVAEATYVGGLISIKRADAATNTITSVLVVGHNSSGVPAAGFGESIDFLLKSSTTVDVSAMSIKTWWLDATHAIRKSAMEIGLYGELGYSPGIRFDVRGTNNLGDGNEVTVSIPGNVATIWSGTPPADTTLAVWKGSASFVSPHLRLVSPGHVGSGLWHDITDSLFCSTTAFFTQFGVWTGDVGTGLVKTTDTLRIQNKNQGVIAVYGDLLNGLAGLRIGDPARLADGFPYFAGTTVIIQSQYDTKSCLQIFGHSATQSAPLQEWCDHAGVMKSKVEVSGVFNNNGNRWIPNGVGFYFQGVDTYSYLVCNAGAIQLGANTVTFGQIFANVDCQIDCFASIGADTVGAKLTVRAGASTGNAVPSKIIIQSTVPVASGATIQTWVDTVIVTNGGVQLATTAAQKVGFFGAAPVVQPTAIVDADGTLADITTKYNALLAKLRTLGLIAT